MANKPSFVQRVRYGWRTFRYGSPYGKLRSPFAWPANAGTASGAHWVLGDFESFVGEGFNANSVIYSAVMYKAKSVIQAPLRAWVGDAYGQRRPSDPGSPLSRLFLKPNSYQSSAEFSMLNVVYLNISGNCFLLMKRLKRGGEPYEVVSLRPDRVRIVPGTGGIKGWLYIPMNRTIEDAVPILPEDLIHVKLPNPMDPYEGMGFGLSPVSPLARSGDVDNNVTAFLKIFFQYGTMTSGILKFDVPLEEEDVQRIKARWREQHGSFENWGDIGVTDQSGTFQRTGLTFQEMGFEALDDRNETRILGPFGVPPILIGARSGLKHSTYSNYDQARTAFWQDTLIPELVLFETEFQLALSSPAEFPAYDVSRVPALRTDVPKLVAAAQKLWAMGVPAQAAFRVVGLPPEEFEGSDQAWVPANVVPLDRALAPPPAPAAPTLPPPTGDAASLTKVLLSQPVTRRELLPLGGTNGHVAN
jgi:HK97 family phage portal protein